MYYSFKIYIVMGKLKYWKYRTIGLASIGSVLIIFVSITVFATNYVDTFRVIVAIMFAIFAIIYAITTYELLKEFRTQGG
jgi:4-amino-4-deoxy-L-arabinose transferase-like glycosyltransferase